MFRTIILFSFLFISRICIGQETSPVQKTVSRTSKIEVKNLLLLSYGSNPTHVFFDGMTTKMKKYFAKKEVTVTAFFNDELDPGSHFKLKPSDIFDAVMIFHPLDSAKVKMSTYELLFPTRQQRRPVPNKFVGPSILIPTVYKQRFGVSVYQYPNIDTAIWECNLIVEFDLKDNDYYKQTSNYLCQSLTKTYFTYNRHKKKNKAD